VTSHSGLALIGRTLAMTRLGKARLGAAAARDTHADCIKSYVGLLCTGKSDFDAIENKRSDPFFKMALGIQNVPSAPSLRQRFDEHAEAMIPNVDNASINFIAGVGASVTLIAFRSGQRSKPGSTNTWRSISMCFQWTIHEPRRRACATPTRVFNGYARLAAYLGEEGWCLACELRPGSQHGQMEFIYFLERVPARRCARMRR
jgi:hypothetical protein